MPRSLSPDTLGLQLERLRATAPRVHCISNLVAANDCANAVLACGASPIMAEAPDEAAEVTAICQALSLSLGTPNPRKAAALQLSGRAANAAGIPVVFDPVGVGASHFRQQTAQSLLADVHLTLLRCNASELAALAGHRLSGEGVDAAAADPAATRALALSMARSLGCIVAVTGQEDIVTNGSSVCCISNGTPLLRRVTGTGCMLTVLCAAFLAANPDTPFEAACAAVCMMGLCGEQAAARMGALDGTGSLRLYLMDALSTLTPAQLEEGANYEVYP